MLGGALAPTVASLLVAASGGQSWSVAAYVAAVVVIMVGCTLGRTSRKAAEIFTIMLICTIVQ